MSQKDLEALAQSQAAQAQQLRGSVAYGVQQSPDEYARAMRLAREAGVSPTLAQGNPTLAQATQADQVVGDLSQAPATAAWFSNPHNAAVAHDDTPALTKLEGALTDALDPFGVRQHPVDAAKGLYYSAKAGFQQTAGGLLDFAGRVEDYLATLGSALRKQFTGQQMTPQEQVAWSAAQSQNPGQAVAVGGLSAIAPKVSKAGDAILGTTDRPNLLGQLLDPLGVRGTTPEELRGAAQHLLQVDAPATEAQAPQNLTGKAAGVVGGILPHLSPLALVTMAAQGFGTGEATAQAQGADEGSQMISGLSQGGINALLGRTGGPIEGSINALLSPIEGSINALLGRIEGGINALLGRTGGPIEGSLARRLVVGGLRTGAAFTAAGGANRAISEAANPQGGSPLAAAAQPGDIGKDLAQGFLFHAVPEVAREGLTRAAKAFQDRRTVAQTQAFLQAVADPAQASKLAKRMPEGFQELVAHVTANGPVQEVKIAPEAFQTLFQSRNEDPAKAAADLGVPNYQEALAAGTDLSIPIAQFTAKVATKPDLFRAMAPDLKLSTGDPTARDLQAKPEQPMAPPAGEPTPEVTQAVQGADAESQNASLQAIHEDMVSRLTGAGFDPSAADAEATRYTAVIGTLAQREGLAPEELHSLYAPTVTRAGLEERPGTPVPELAVDRMAAQDPTTLDQGPVKSFSEVPEEAKPLLHTARQADKVNQWAAESGLNPDHWRPFDPAKESQPAFIEQRISDVMDNPEAFRKLYSRIPETEGGKIINGDIAEMLIVGDGDPKKGMEDIEPWAADGYNTAVRKLWNDQLKELPEGSKVWIMAGGPGVGKSKASQLLVSEGHADLVFDSNGHTEGRLDINAKQAEAAGMEVNIGLVKRDHAESVAAMLDRGDRELRTYHPLGMAQVSEAAARRVLGFSQSEVGQKVHFWTIDTKTDEKPVMTGFRPGNPDTAAALEAARQEAHTSLEAAHEQARLQAGHPNDAGGSGGVRGEGRGEEPQNPGDHRPGGRQEGGPGSDAGASPAPGSGPDAAPSDGLTFYQPSRGPMEFGSKAWNEYYRENKGSFAPQGETKGVSKKAARKAMRDAATQSGISAEDARREADLQAEKHAYEEYRRQWEAFDREVKTIQAGAVHESGANRGFIQFGEGRKFQIGLLKNADLSTFAHETGHLWLEVMGDLAARPEASEGLKEDYGKILKFLGVESRDQIGTDQHEKFARANEAYLREGKAPSEGLRGTFQRIKYWMAMIYRHARDLKVNLNDEIRGVFDRMHASDAEITAARVGMDKTFEPLFAKPEDMGASEGLFKKYLDATAKTRETAQDALESRLAREAQREHAKWWKEESAKVREEVAAEVNDEPAQVAYRALSEGKLDDGTPIKLSREDLVYRYGEGTLKELPKAFGSLYRREGGVDVDTAAEMLGFQSGDELVQALREREPLRQRIDRLTDLRMKQTHGDLLLDGSVHDAALEALHNSHYEEAKALELKALRQKQAEVDPFVKQALREASAAQKEGIQKALEVPPIAQFKAAAEQFISQTALKDLDPNRYLTTQRVKAREAYEALGKGKYAEAADAKQKEILNHFLYREAVKARDEAQAIQAYAKRVSGDKYRAKLGMAGEKAGTDFLAQHDAILDRFDFRKATDKELAQRKENLQAWVDKMIAEGESPAIADEIANEGYRKNYREMTVPELQAVRDALVNIGHLANEINKIRMGEAKVEKDEAIRSMVQALQKHEGVKYPVPLFPESNPALKDKLGHWVRSGDALLIRMEQLVDWADKGDVNGPWHQAIWNPIAEAQVTHDDLAKEVTAKVQEALETMPKEIRTSLLDKVDTPLGTMSRRNLITVLAHMGNAENFEKLTRGYGWSQEDVFKAAAKLKPEEARFVQGLWNTMESLRPLIGALEKRTTGLEPKWVEARPFDLQLESGETVHLDGGYMPLKYDPRFSNVGERQVENAVVSLEKSGFSRPGLPNGFTKSRTRFVGKLLLDYEQVVLPHLAQVIKDLSHREAVKQVYQLITHEDVKRAFTESFGEEHTRQLMPWLRNVVNDANGSAVQGLGALQKFMATARRNTVLAAMGFRLSTALVQYSGVTRSLHYVKGEYLAKGLGEFLRNPKQATAMVRDLSGEMRGRAENLDRDFREMHLRATQGRWDNFKRQTGEFAFHGIAMADVGIGVPTWLGAYRQALDAGKDTQTAVLEADRAVRLTQPTAGPKDLPPIMRQDETAKLLTMFYGHFSVLYQNLRDAGHKVQGASDMPKFAAAALFSVMIPGVLGELIKGKGPDDKENKGEWAALEALHFATASVPLLRDASEAVIGTLEGHKRDPRFSPVVDTILNNAKAGQAVAGAVRGDHVKPSDVAWKTAEAAGYDLGIPGTGQIVSTGKYAQKRLTHETPSEDALDTAKHLAFGGGGKK